MVKKRFAHHPKFRVKDPRSALGPQQSCAPMQFKSCPEKTQGPVRGRMLSISASRCDMASRDVVPPRNDQWPIQPAGPVAQWIRHRPTEPGIAGSSPAGVIFSNWQVSNIVPHAISPFHTAHHCPHFQLWTIEGDDDGDGGATGPCDPTPSTQRARTTPAQSAQRKTLNLAHSSIQRRQR